MGDDATNDLKLAFARMEASVSTELRHLVHDLKNFKMALDNFVPRREIEQNTRAMEGEHDALKERVAKLEGHLVRAAWALATSWVGGLMVAVKAFK